MPTGVYEKTEDHKRNISKALMGHKLSDETREKISKANKIALNRPEVVEKMSKAKIGRKLSNETRKKMSIANTGENNPSWKGDNVRYSGLHERIRKLYGKPKLCKFCGTTKAKKYDWANISGEYKMDRSDWLRLCVSCHRKFDNVGGKNEVV